MSRINFEETPVAEFEHDELSTLINAYFTNNSEMKDYKKICDNQNAKIKELMKAESITEKVTDLYTAKVSVETRESFIEEKLIEVLRKYGIVAPIKTREYVDMEVLENILYNGVLSPSLIEDLDKCKDVKEIVKLRVSKNKKKKGE